MVQPLVLPRRVSAAHVATVCVLVLLTPLDMAKAVDLSPTPVVAADPSVVIAHLEDLGFPVGQGLAVTGAETRRGLCIARDLAGLGASRSTLRVDEAASLLALTSPLPAPKAAIEGMNVSITCQAGYYVSEGQVERIFKVTTGTGDGTPRGVFKVQRRTDGWRRSTLYPVMLYKPVNINGAIAVHGVPTPSMIRTSPASHGCIRVPNRQMDWLFPRLQHGEKVRVYGRW
jgi:hypothetical protein